MYRINYNTENEYYIIDTNKKYTKETVPNIPFNRSKSGYDNIIKYKNKYVGNNSNDMNLINNLPLASYGYTFQIDGDKLGLTINYHITDWYINENNYLEKSLIYNTVCIFSLIDNLDYIKFNFSGDSYTINKTIVKTLYPNYEEVMKNNNSFNKYLESKINDEVFISDIFNKLFKGE